MDTTMQIRTYCENFACQNWKPITTKNKRGFRITVWGNGHVRIEDHRGRTLKEFDAIADCMIIDGRK